MTSKTGNNYGERVTGNGERVMVRDYKDLQVWQKSIELVKEIYFITKELPREESFNLISQMRRSAVSVSSNIAEGWMRQHTNEYIQFIYHALGSCGELDTQVIISNHLGYVDNKTMDSLSEIINHVIRMLRNLVKSLKK